MATRHLVISSSAFKGLTSTTTPPQLSPGWGPCPEVALHQRRQNQRHHAAYCGPGKADIKNPPRENLSLQWAWGLSQ